MFLIAICSRLFIVTIFLFLSSTMISLADLRAWRGSCPVFAFAWWYCYWIIIVSHNIDWMDVWPGRLVEQHYICKWHLQRFMKRRQFESRMPGIYFFFYFCQLWAVRGLHLDIFSYIGHSVLLPWDQTSLPWIPEIVSIRIIWAYSFFEDEKSRRVSGLFKNIF